MCSGRRCVCCSVLYMLVTLRCCGGSLHVQVLAGTSYTPALIRCSPRRASHGWRNPRCHCLQWEWSLPTLWCAGTTPQPQPAGTTADLLYAALSFWPPPHQHEDTASLLLRYQDPPPLPPRETDLINVPMHRPLPATSPSRMSIQLQSR